MRQSIGAITLLVREYDEAIDYFTGPLGFDLIEDARLSPDKRWVRVMPKGGVGTALLLARAATADQEAQIGNKAGGRVLRHAGVHVRSRTVGKCAGSLTSIRMLRSSMSVAEPLRPR